MTPRYQMTLGKTLSLQSRLHNYDLFEQYQGQNSNVEFKEQN